MNQQKPETRNQRPEIHLHIEELVLHGFAPGDRQRLGEVVEQELTRMLSEPPVSPALKKNVSLDRVDGGAFCMANPAKPAIVGAQIAGAVFGGIRL
jgi:hypothetical protein